MICEGHYTPNECHVLPSLVVYAGKCGGCPKIHAWQLFTQWLWWGFTISVGVEPRKDDLS